MKHIKRLNEEEGFGIPQIPDEELTIAEEVARKIGHDLTSARNIIVTLLREVDMDEQASEVKELLDEYIGQKQGGIVK